MLDERAERTDSALDLASAGGTMERIADASWTMEERGRVSTPADLTREMVWALGGGISCGEKLRGEGGGDTFGL